MDKEELKEEHTCCGNCNCNEENQEHECHCNGEGNCECEENCHCKEDIIDDFDESEEVLILKNNIQNLEEKLKASTAELINYRKRKDEETATMLKYANADLILELIPSIDNFERAIAQANKSENSEIKKFMTGINLIYQGIHNTLTKFGVEEINRVGQEYDPNLEQALCTDCVEEQEDEVVLEVLQKGYKLKDRVIRAASVKINQK